MSVPIERIDSKPLPAAGREIRATLIVRNEIVRLPRLLDYYRGLGVDRFLTVDNGSKDGSLEYLLAQPDVHVFSDPGSFATHKAVWRAGMLTEHCQGIWTLNIDADEFFVFPGMEELKLREFCRFLDSEHSLGLFSPMVDMYSREPLDEVRLNPGDDLLDVYPYFDARGYSLQFRLERVGNTTPAWRLRGGSRERIFFSEQTPVRFLQQLAAAWYFDIGRDQPPLPARIRGIGAQVDKLARKFLLKRSPELGKIPLLRWDNALGIQNDLSAMHWLSPQLLISTCWGAVLHLKHLPDYKDRVKEAVDQNLYGQADDEYKRYHEVLQQGDDILYFNRSSRRFESTADLIDVGLMRHSKGLADFIGGVADGAGSVRHDEGA